MKHEQSHFNVTAALLSAFTILCGIGCVITGFHFSLLSMLPAALILPVFGLMCSLFAKSKKAWHILIPGLCVLLIVLLWGREILLSLEALLYRITKYYDGGYGWGYIRWSQESLTDVSIAPALIVLGCLLMLPIHWTLHYRMWIGLALIPGILPLGVCCVVTDTIPSALFVTPLLVCLLLLVLPHLSLRQKNPPKQLTALLLGPVIVFSLVLSIVCCGDTKTDQAQKLQDAFLDLLGGAISGDLPDQGLISVPGTPPPQVTLRNIGPMEFSGTRAMYVQTERYEGLLYLRGRSYDTYTGTSWVSKLDTTGENGWPNNIASASSALKDTLSVSTLFDSDIQFFPYYLMSSDWSNKLIEGGYVNESGSRNYSYQWKAPSADLLSSFKPLSDEEEAAYLALPETTRQAAEVILQTILDSDAYTKSEKINKIRQYVEQSAAYDLNTPSMPEGNSDFALWFLEEGNTGYCVHFASAATVLLRAAGIPARYVSGYISYAIPDEQMPVTDEQTHAWVEYLDPRQGWTVLEATPGAENIPPIPTETTEPSQTTQPSDPSQTTEPSEFTKPSQTLPSTQPSIGTKPSAPDQTQPQASIPGGDNTGISFPVTQVLKVLLIVAAVWLLVAGQYHLRWNLRYRRHHQGNPKRQAIHRWNYVRYLSRLTRQTQPEELYALTEKAVFSQHRLTRQELSQYDTWIAEAHKKLLDRPLPVKWLLQLLFAIKDTPK